MPIGCQATITRETARICFETAFTDKQHEKQEYRWILEIMELQWNEIGNQKCTHSKFLHKSSADISTKDYNRQCVYLKKTCLNCSLTRPTFKPAHHTPTLFVSWKESTPGNLSSSGTKTFFKRISPFWTIRRPILFSIFVAVNPGASFFTINLKQKAEKNYHTRRGCQGRKPTIMHFQTKASTKYQQNLEV